MAHASAAVFRGGLYDAAPISDHLCRKPLSPYLAAGELDLAALFATDGATGAADLMGGAVGQRERAARRLRGVSDDRALVGRHAGVHWRFGGRQRHHDDDCARALRHGVEPYRAGRPPAGGA